MNKKKIWFLIPSALLPYMVLCALAVVFLSTKHPLSQWIMEAVFRNNGLLLVAAVLLFSVLVAALSALCFVTAIRKGWDPVPLARTAVIIKLCQIPAYILVLALGVLLATSLFTIPFAIALFALDCLTLVLTGLPIIAAAINATRKGICAWNDIIWLILPQFVFCADVVAAIIFYNKLRKR